MSDEQKTDWSGIYRQALEQGGLVVPYREVGPLYGLEEVEAAVEAMRGEILTQGPFLKAFQEEFAEYVGTDYALGVSSCTGTLEIATQLLEIGEGDEVIVPAITFIATVIPLLRVKAKVVFADLDPATHLISPKSIEESITDRTVAIYLVHMNGMPCDMDPIMELARSHNLKVVEDCAHSMGAEYKGRKTGAIGDIGCFSFHTVKNISTLGEGGMLTTNDPEFARLIPLARWVGMDLYEDLEKYWIPFFYDIRSIKGTVPYNFCMGEVQANVGRVQLKRLAWMNERRRAMARRMTEGIFDLEEISVPEAPDDRVHSYHLYPILYDGSANGANRDHFMDILFHEFGIKTAPHYLPPYKFEIMRELGYPDDLCPEAERIYSQLTATPMNMSLTDEQVDYMVDSIVKTVCKLRSGKTQPEMNFS